MNRILAILGFSCCCMDHQTILNDKASKKRTLYTLHQNLLCGIKCHCYAAGGLLAGVQVEYIFIFQRDIVTTEISYIY